RKSRHKAVDNRCTSGRETVYARRRVAHATRFAKWPAGASIGTLTPYTEFAMPYERRHYVRVQFDSPGQLRWAGQAIPVRVLDLSLKGALLQAMADTDTKALHMGLQCELTVPLAHQEYIAMAI